MPFDASAGGASSNSFVTVAEADDYFSLQLHAAEWPSTSTGGDLLTKQKALVSATRMLDAQDYVGYKATFTQALRWPRIWNPVTAGENGFFVDDYYVSPGAIPGKLKEATCDLALFLLQKDPTEFVDEDLSQFSEITLPGGLSMKMRPGAVENRLPQNVIDKLGSLITAGYGSARLRRK